MSSASTPTVSIVDDDRGVRQAIQDLVESVGLRAESFATGQEFLENTRPRGSSCLVCVGLEALQGTCTIGEYRHREITLTLKAVAVEMSLQA